MCVGVPGRILEIEAGLLPMARVDFAGTVRDVSLALVPDAQVGQFVLVNMGSAVHTLDEAEAEDLMGLLDDFNAFHEAQDRPPLEPPGRPSAPLA
ncbi:HypC/HybG/HupF family hydrogenase formation chaperone [Mesoterricola sediminis]|uniref:Hydrogenase assembly protein HypC n=1 Tax=Mesoterricola sediminis TaxID=2927980 RepID=A0AA48GT16_9BACT|nr:HypC/HybG/HupF family hydrogenase formation chaperone [Mesoterricola sediminis]BDU75659.1 hydrogenase assembly protein HypC [Mesoterricola sediminis]